MTNKIEKLNDLLANQNTRFKKALATNVGLLILVLILFAVNIVSTVKPNQIGNPIYAVIIIYVILIYLFIWSMFCIVKNTIGIIGINKTNKLVGKSSIDSSEVESIPTWMFFNGEMYDSIDHIISNLVAPLTFHLIKKKEKLLSLNIRQGFMTLVALLTAIAFFVSQVVYWNNNGGWSFSHAGIIIGFVFMLVIFAIVFLWLIPRQVIINIKINKDNKKAIDEYSYFHAQRIFLTTYVLEKFWNDNLDKE